MELAELDGDEAAAEEQRDDEDGATPEEADAEDGAGEADEADEEGPAPTAAAATPTPDASEAEADVTGAQGPASNLDSPNVESEDDLVVLTKKGPSFCAGRGDVGNLISWRSQPTHGLCSS